MSKALQAKHIDEAAILRFLESLDVVATHWPDDSPFMPSLRAVSSLASVPEKVLLAKLAAMNRKGLVHGCACGCRGDWRITEAGRDALREAEK